MRVEVDRARALFAEGRELVPRISGPLAVDIDLFSRGGLAILDRIEAGGYDVLGGRPALTRWTKLGLLGRALLGLGLARMGGRRRTTRTSSIPDTASRDTAAASISSTASRAPIRPLESPQ